ncbi:GNAT family N-acetyltransferase [Aquisediminimonas sediminicola]|uniref:GNAT family N-acetyltransferase n=1 Tax=Alteraquisediminimonas sediminicola TaxID=2676787 RepID=UPI001C8EB4BB
MPNTPKLSTASGFAQIDAGQWDRCAGNDDPFLTHAFMRCLEQSGSAIADTGWQPMPLLATNDAGELIGATPLWGKSHSQGEYIFDHGWADAWQRAGGRYYPKLLSAVPFTPVTGRRLLSNDPVVASHLIAGMAAMTEQNNLSSAHANFITEDEVALFEQAGWLIRDGLQYHWENRGYQSFDDFLGEMPSRKRKTIRKERDTARQGLDIRHLTGSDITEAHWDAFWAFYQDTGARKWGTPYLTRSFFSLLNKAMADRILLVFAYDGDRPIAGALNLIGAEALFGRYWGTTDDRPFLHFELCYYQAMDFAIEHHLARVEAGAQGEHKIARGYAPIITRSAHYLPDTRFREAVADFVARERRTLQLHATELAEMLPFRRPDD